VSTPEETFEVPRSLIETAIALLSASADDRRGAADTVEALRAICPVAPDQTPAVE